MKQLENKRYIKLLNALNIDFQKAFNGVKLSNYAKAAKIIKVNYSANYKRKHNRGYIGTTITSSVLKKYWKTNGDICIESIPRDLTLNCIAFALGYDSIDDFENYTDSIFSCKNNIYFDPLSIDVEKLYVEQNVLVGWKPYHYILFEYLGDHQFKILQKSNTFKSSTQVGDIIESYGFGVRVNYIGELDNLLDPPAYYDIDEDVASGIPLFPQIIIRKKSEKRKVGDFTNGCYVLG